jgi:uncharacterized protein
MEFEWDKNKNLLNADKHGIDFIQAKEVFNDDKRKTSPDLRKDYGEDRWITIGKVVDIIIVVVYTIRDNVFRLISARYAKKSEGDRYNKN